VLLRAGAQVDARDHYGATALHYAAAGGHLAVMRVLLERGADIDAPGRFGRAPLHAALPHPEAVRLLLDSGAQLEACDKREWTALHWSVADGYRESACLLLERGADVNHSISNGFTPLYYASENGLDYYTSGA
jgi:ankyrin repeat protein